MSGVVAVRASGGLHLSSPWHPPTWDPPHLPPPQSLVAGRIETPRLHTKLDAVHNDTKWLNLVNNVVQAYCYVQYDCYNSSFEHLTYKITSIYVSAQEPSSAIILYN